MGRLSAAVSPTLYCPDISTTLISVSQLRASKRTCYFNGNNSTICLVQNSISTRVAQMYEVNGLYRLDAVPQPSRVYANITSSIRTVDN